MSTTINLPALTRDELADLRWLAAEGVADSAENIDLGGTPHGFPADMSRFISAGWALMSLGVSRCDPVPGSKYDGDDDRWKGRCPGTAAVATLLQEADRLEEWIDWITGEGRDIGFGPTDEAHYAGISERVARVRSILSRLPA